MGLVLGRHYDEKDYLKHGTDSQLDSKQEKYYEEELQKAKAEAEAIINALPADQKARALNPEQFI